MRTLRLLTAVILGVILALSLVACGGESEESSQTTSDSVSTAVSDVSVTESSEPVSEEEAKTFTVTVVDGDGNPVSGVMVQICLEACIPAVTNADGVAVFNAEIVDGHKLSVSSCPEGYSYEGEAEIYLESGATEYTLELTKAE